MVLQLCEMLHCKDLTKENKICKVRWKKTVELLSQ